MIDYMIEDIIALYDTLMPVRGAIAKIALWLLALYLSLAFLEGFLEGFQRAADAFWRHTWNAARTIARITTRTIARWVRAIIKKRR